VGRVEFLKFYFLCGIGAGVFDVVLTTLFSSPFSITIGCSGALYGLLLAFGLIFLIGRFSLVRYSHQSQVVCAGHRCH